MASTCPVSACQLSLARPTAACASARASDGARALCDARMTLARWSTAPALQGSTTSFTPPRGVRTARSPRRLPRRGRAPTRPLGPVPPRRMQLRCSTISSALLTGGHVLLRSATAVGCTATHHPPGLSADVLPDGFSSHYRIARQTSTILRCRPPDTRRPLDPIGLDTNLIERNP